MTASNHHHENTNARLADVFAEQKKAFQTSAFTSLIERKARLKQIKYQLRARQDSLCEAVSNDFGSRSPSETRIIELLSSRLEIDHALSKLKRWMKPERRSTELLFLSNALKVIYQPKGVVGIIVPWNFPIYLAIGPLVAAVAAGNRVMLKLSEFTPATNAVLKALLADIFPNNEVAAFGEELTDPSVFSELPFDHLIFTGSTHVGRLVMTAAAKNLTPVTLELGGKSPAIIADDYLIKDAALRLVHGKCTNGGQACVAPDYALVPEGKQEQLVQAIKTEFNRRYGDFRDDTETYTSIINRRQQQRLLALLEDARARGARVIPCAPYDANQDGCRIPLHIVTGLTPEMALAKEEIFGPILPITTYTSLDEALRYLAQQSRHPLALYLFSHSRKTQKQVLANTQSGGVTLNDWAWHAVNHDVPFGGVGESGMGSYHGEEGFRALSHGRPVFERHRFFPTQLFYPPYGRFVQRLALWLWVRKIKQ